MGFWNALSVLAPVAPALSDARDIRTQREQDAAKFAQDSELKKAQTTVEQMTGQLDQQRIDAGTKPMFKEGSQPEFNPTAGTYQQPAWSAKKGAYELVNVPGASPQELNKQQLDSFKQNRSMAKSIMPSGTSDENLDYLAYTLSGFKPPPVTKITQLTGDAGKPFKGTDGSYYVNAKNADGSVVAMPLGPNYQPPAPKPSTSPAAIYTNLLAKKILADKNQGPPLTNEDAALLKSSLSAMDMPGITRSQAWAQAAAQNHLQAVTNPDTGMDTLVPVAAGVAAFNQGQPYLAGVVSAPTGMDKKNQMLAQSALTQIDSMERVLAADPSLTGPGSGQLTKLATFLGTQDPGAQQFLAAATFLSEHGVGVFGGRNIHSIDDLQKLMGDLKTNPEALKAALEQARTTMTPWTTAGGRLLGPKVAGSGGAGDVKQHSLRAAMALPFNKGKTAAQVKADLEAHHYKVVP